VVRPSRGSSSAEEATAYVMSAITKLLEQIRNEKAPSEIFDPKKSACHGLVILRKIADEKSCGIRFWSLGDNPRSSNG